MRRKAEMGIGVLIVFIAAIIVAAIGATVILHTQNRLQITSLKVGNTAREAIGTNVFVQTVKGMDGRDGSIGFLEIIVKLSDGGSPMKLNDTIISIQTPDDGVSLVYIGTNATAFYVNKEARVILEDIGMNPVRLRTDLDYDGREDSVKLKNDTTLIFDLSRSDDIEISIPSVALANTTLSVDEDLTSSTYGYLGTLEITGITELPNVIDTNATFVIYPKELGKGAYSVEFPMVGRNHVRDSLMFGDVMRVFIELPSEVGEQKEISIDFITPVGTPMEKRIKTPDAMTSQTVMLFP
jgi:archaellin